MNVSDFKPSDFMAFQGDVSIVAIPDSIKLTLKEEIQPVDNKLILLEGEMTGHHHAIDVLEPVAFNPVDMDLDIKQEFIEVNKKNKKTVKNLMNSLDSVKEHGHIKMYRDAESAQAMQKAGYLTRTDLVIGTLVVTDQPVLLKHQEHQTIRIHPGRYLIGRQVESSYAEERRVAD